MNEGFNVSVDVSNFDNESEYSVTTNRSETSRQGHRRHRDRSNRRHKSRGASGEFIAEDGGEKVVTIQTPSLDGSRKNESRGAEGVVTINVTEDQNWGETNTLISGTTDVTQLSHESLAKLRKDEVATIGFHDCGFVATVIFALLSYVSPIAIVIIPRVWLVSGPASSECGTSCKVCLLLVYYLGHTIVFLCCLNHLQLVRWELGTLIGMVFKLLILLAASWAIFFRKQRTNMPRVFMFRALIMFLVLLITITYWLFFAVWIVEMKEKEYEAIISYADSFTNCLLFVHYLSLVLLELRQLQTMFVLEVIRTTDGQRRFYNVGNLSIQRCSVRVLEKYYCDFPVYNPALMRTPSRSLRMKQLNNHKFKEYDVDGLGGSDATGKNRAIIAAVARRRDAGHNELYYEEAEYEKRVRKRKARLIAATEDAFAHIRRAAEQEIGIKTSETLMDSLQASEAIFPALARALQKYLRTTRQHQHYDIENILNHLSMCIKQDMSPKAFLERYLHPGPYLTYSPRQDSSQWTLVSDEPLVNMIKDGTVFRMNQLNYSLVITVHSTPRIRLKEEFVDSSSHRFVMNMQTETSL